MRGRYASKAAPVTRDVGNKNMKTENIICTHCGSVGKVSIVPKLKNHNTLALLAGGIVFSLLWCGGRKTDFKCTKCDGMFSFRTTGAWISLVGFWVCLGLVILAILTFEPDGTE